MNRKQIKREGKAPGRRPALQPRFGGRAEVGKRTGFAHLATGSCRPGPDNSTQVVDFPHLSGVRVFRREFRERTRIQEKSDILDKEAMESGNGQVATDGTPIKHGFGGDCPETEQTNAEPCSVRCAKKRGIFHVFSRFFTFYHREQARNSAIFTLFLVRLYFIGKRRADEASKNQSDTSCANWHIIMKARTWTRIESKRGERTPERRRIPRFRVVPLLRLGLRTQSLQEKVADGAERGSTLHRSRLSCRDGRIVRLYANIFAYFESNYCFPALWLPDTGTQRTKFVTVFHRRP